MVALGSEQEPFDAAVIGAGLAGLTAAYTLTRRGLSVTVLEKDYTTGGRARSKVVDGIPVNLGAQFVSGFYKATINLVRELGISDELVRRSQRAFVVRQGAPRGLWPLSLLLKDSALSASAKVHLLRLAPSLLVNWSRLDITDLARAATLDSQSTADFMLCHVGSESLEFFFGPLLRALLHWEPATTSLPVVFAALKAAVVNHTTYMFRSGIGRLAETLAAHNPVTHGAEVCLVRRDDDGPYEVQAVVDGRPSTVYARAVICATPADAVHAMMPWLPSTLTGFLDHVSYSSTMMLTYRVPAHAKGYPRGAILFPTTIADLASVNPFYRYDDGATFGTRLLSISVSDGGYEIFGGLSDEVAGEKILARVRQVVGTGWMPQTELINVQRWPAALPRFDVGYLRAAAAFQRAQGSMAGIAFAGDYLGGPFVDGAIRSGVEAAAHILRTRSG